MTSSSHAPRLLLTLLVAALAGGAALALAGLAQGPAGVLVPPRLPVAVLAGVGVAVGLLAGGAALALARWPAPARVAEGGETPPRVTEEGVGRMLTGLGYTYTTGTADGALQYFIRIERHDVTTTVTVDISQNKANLWISSFVREIPEGVAALSDRLTALMKSSWDNAPLFFSLAGGRRLYLMLYIPTQGATREMLRDGIGQLIDTLARTLPLWETDDWERLDTGERFRLTGLGPAGGPRDGIRPT
jgi:hypothetical protein